MKEREFTVEMLQRLIQANKTTKGKYHMYWESKSDKRFKFAGFNGVPIDTGTIKTIKGRMIIYTKILWKEYRYFVTPEVKALLGLEVQA